MTLDAAFERLCDKHGDVLTNGGTPERYFAATRLAKQIARAMRVDVQQVIGAATEGK